MFAYLSLYGFLLIMVIVLEEYRGFQIRRHEKSVELPWNRVGITICVHCIEGAEPIYRNLAENADKHLPVPINLKHDRQRGISTYFNRGKCKEDGKYVVSITPQIDNCTVEPNYELNDFNRVFIGLIELIGNAKFADDYHPRLTVNHIVGVYRKVIDSLWEDADRILLA